MFVTVAHGAVAKNIIGNRSLVHLLIDRNLVEVDAGRQNQRLRTPCPASRIGQDENATLTRGAGNGCLDKLCVIFAGMGCHSSDQFGPGYSVVEPWYVVRSCDPPRAGLAIMQHKRGPTESCPIKGRAQAGGSSTDNGNFEDFWKIFLHIMVPCSMETARPVKSSHRTRNSRSASTFSGFAESHQNMRTNKSDLLNSADERHQNHHHCCAVVSKLPSAALRLFQTPNRCCETRKSQALICRFRAIIREV